VESEIVFLVKESEEGGYEARALSHSIFTEADSPEELRAMVKDAVACHFDSGNGPKTIRLHRPPGPAPSGVRSVLLQTIRPARLWLPSDIRQGPPTADSRRIPAVFTN